jgi:hypothetical protein
MIPIQQQPQVFVQQQPQVFVQQQPQVFFQQPQAFSNVVYQQPGRDWSHDLCGCLEDCGECKRERTYFYKN